MTWTPEAIRNLRKRLVITQAELAKRLDTRCSVQTVSRWENGGSNVGKYYRKRLDRISKHNKQGDRQE